MTKLTKKTSKGVALVMADFYADPDEQKADVKVRIRKALEKLYLYETLELEPEEIYDLLQSTAIIRKHLNKLVSWKSPHKDNAYISQLAAVKISRDDKTGKLRLSAELKDPKGNMIIGDINHIEELKGTSLE